MKPACPIQERLRHGCRNRAATDGNVLRFLNGVCRFQDRWVKRKGLIFTDLIHPIS